jgi:hypothetical protein
MTMKNEGHREWTTRLSDYLADELDDLERSAMEAHLATCEACNQAMVDLARIVREAGALEDLAPPAHLWDGIAAGIAAGRAGSVLEGDAAVLPFPRARPEAGRLRVEMQPSRLAAAAVVLVALTASVTWWVGSARAGGTAAPDGLGSGPVTGVADGVPAPPPGLADELASLEEVLASARGVLDPNTVRVIERSLSVIEQAIADSREALAQDPENAFLVEHLERMYRRKLVYLQDAVRLVELGA